jgi:hypothetical protein
LQHPDEDETREHRHGQQQHDDHGRRTPTRPVVVSAALHDHIVPHGRAG